MRAIQRAGQAYPSGNQGLSHLSFGTDIALVSGGAGEHETMTLGSLFEKIWGGHRYATVDDIRNVFGDYHNALHWLADFLIGDKKLAEACIIDACGIALTQGPTFHEWLVHWTGRATARCALQRQHAQVAELALTYETNEPIVEKLPPLSAEHFQLLVAHSAVIHARLDVLCRFVLVYRGIAKDACEAVAAELGISPNAVERAYSVALDALDLPERSAIALRKAQPQGHIYHESVLAASID